MVALQPLPGCDGLVYCEKHGHGGLRGWKCPLCRDEPAPKPVSKPRAGKANEDKMAAQLDAAGLGGYLREYRFAEEIGRLFRADLAYTAARLLVDVDGGVHGIHDKRTRDCERTSIAAALGWRHVRVTPAMVKSGRALELVRDALAWEA